MQSSSMRHVSVLSTIQNNKFPHNTPIPYTITHSQIPLVEWLYAACLFLGLALLGSAFLRFSYFRFSNCEPSVLSRVSVSNLFFL